MIGAISMGYYDTAQICLNGHVITDSFRSYPQFARKHCNKCGAPTVTQCSQCRTEIQGDYKSEAVVFVTGRIMMAPRFCHECGKPYPWTAAKVEAVKALADEIQELNEGERSML